MNFRITEQTDDAVTVEITLQRGRNPCDSCPFLIPNYDFGHECQAWKMSEEQEIMFRTPHDVMIESDFDMWYMCPLNLHLITSPFRKQYESRIRGLLEIVNAKGGTENIAPSDIMLALEADPIYYDDIKDVFNEWKEEQ